MTERNRSQAIRPRSWRAFRFRHVVLAAALAACGGVATTGQRTVGGESHFLEKCSDHCDGGLDCVAGICTRGCLASGSDCSDLAPGAACTNQSVEPGAVAVCDLTCEQDRDCAALGPQFGCPAGFCRDQAAAPPPSGNNGEGGAPVVADPSDGGAPLVVPGEGGAPIVGPPLGEAGSGGEPPITECQGIGSFGSECTLEQTCQELSCDDGFSQFDANGCLRYCQTSQDCAAGTRCRDTVLALTDNDCPAPGSEVEGCYLTDGACHCSITDDCRRPRICVDATRFPESEDCNVTGASCQALNNAVPWLETVAMQSNPNGPPAAACLDKVQAALATRDCP